MLNSLVKELASIDSKETNDTLILESITDGTVADVKPDDATPEVCPEFEKALADLEIPEDAPQETKDDYILNRLDQVFGNTDEKPEPVPTVAPTEVVTEATKGKTLSMSEKDYNAMKSMLAAYGTATPEEQTATKNKARVFILAILKGLENASLENPVDDRVQGTINHMYKTFVTEKFEYNKDWDAKQAVSAKLKAIFKALPGTKADEPVGDQN